MIQLARRICESVRPERSNYKQLLQYIYHNEILGYLKSINFPFGTNGNLMVLCVPILCILEYIWL